MASLNNLFQPLQARQRVGGTSISPATHARSLAFGELSAYKSPEVQCDPVVESVSGGFPEWSVHQAYEEVKDGFEEVAKILFQRYTDHRIFVGSIC